MAFKQTFSIGGRTIGIGEPAYLIAEIGRNHNADMDLARKMIDGAVSAGADAVKFQSFTAKELLIRELPSVSHIKETADRKSAYDSTEEVELRPENHALLRDYAREKGIEFFSTPEDHSMVALLESVKVPVFKIASLDVTYLDLIEAIAATGKPVIMSTGMAYLGEVEKALLTLERLGVTEVALLHCTSNYPPRPADVNLNAIATMRRAFDVPVGYSDHTTGIGVSIAAVALGACVIERHFTLDKDLPGPDQRLSVLPGEFEQMAREIRDVEQALGSAAKRPAESEMEMRRLHRRRLVASRDISRGTVLTREDISCKCSEFGLEPENLEFLIGRPAAADLPMDSALTWDSVRTGGE